MANSKVVLADGTVVMDLTADTVSADKMLSGTTAHDKSGAAITGTCTFNNDTTDGTAAESEILATKTAYARGAKLTGSMPNIGKQNGTISTKAGSVTISQGYHDGSGKVSISSTEQSKMIPGNIKSGIQLLGVTGTYGGESVSAQAKSATPSFSTQTITPDSGYDYLSQVSIAAIPVTYTNNAAGGKTVTIG